MPYTSLETRQEINRMYYENGYTVRQIAHQLSISPSTVHFWLNRDSLEDPYQTKKKTGRPRVTNEETDRQIYEMSVSDPFLPATDIGRRIQLSCSAETIRHRLKEKGLVCRIPVRKDYLRPIHRQKRYEFALHYAEWRTEEWSRVIFSDEKIFSSIGYGPIRVWRPKNVLRYENERYFSSSLEGRHRSGRFSLAVWMCMCGHFPNQILRIGIQHLNADYYISNILNSILLNHNNDDEEELDPLFNEHNLLFMHDLSPIHTSLRVRSWLQEHRIPMLEDWPPKGADLNPVENVWAELERRLANRIPRNRHELWDMVRDTFYSLEDSYFETLIESMPRRIAGVIRQEGGWTKY